MPMTAAQIVTRACSIAKCPGFTTQAGQYLNAVLGELCQTYDLEITKKNWNGSFDTSLNSTEPNSQPGSGPYDAPTDFLRVAGPKESRWFLLGVPYPMIPIDMEEFDNTVQQAGLASYSYWYSIDMQLTPPGMVVYPPPSGNFPFSVRYFSQMPDIATPETSTDIPWFVNQTYLYTRLAGELMKATDDSRADDFLGEGPQGAQGILNRYLKLQGNKSTRSQKVTLDRRQFGRSFSNLRNTKTVGWAIALMFATPAVLHAVLHLPGVV